MIRTFELLLRGAWESRRREDFGSEWIGAHRNKLTQLRVEEGERAEEIVVKGTSLGVSSETLLSLVPRLGNISFAEVCTSEITWKTCHGRRRKTLRQAEKQNLTMLCMGDWRLRRTGTEVAEYRTRDW